MELFEQEASADRTSPVRRLWTWLTSGPAYPANAADRRFVELLGLQLPVRATIVVVAVLLLLLLDYHGRIDEVLRPILGEAGASAADAQRIRSLGRAVLLGLVPLVIVLVGLRDRPARYGLRLGDWRAGMAIALTGIALMVPIVLLVVRLPAFAGYYAPQATDPADVVLTTALEVIPAEFFFRGFLLFALLRAVGPLGVVLATMPFAFSHLGKPEVETLSTIGGGLLYGWLDWRTGSVLWSGLAHTAILSLAVIAAGWSGIPAA